MSIRFEADKPRPNIPNGFTNNSVVECLKLFTESLPPGTPTDIFNPYKDTPTKKFVIQPTIKVEPQALILTNKKGTVTHKIYNFQFAEQGIRASLIFEQDFHAGRIFPD